MKKSIGIYEKTFIIILCLGMVLIISGFFHSNASSSINEHPASKTALPNFVEKIDSHTTKYVFHLNSFDEEGLSLHFITDLKTVQVYNGTTPIYEIKDGNTFLGKTPGKIFHFIELPLDHGSITVLIHGKYADENTDHPQFWVGDQQVMFSNNILHALPYATIYFLTFVCGIALFLFWSIVRNELKNEKMGLYFSLLLITTGLWLIRGSDFICLLFKNHFALYFMGYILFLQIPALFFAFSIYYWQLDCKKWIKNTYYGLSFINMIVCILLHISGILEFKESSLLTHLLLIAALLYAFYGMILYWKRFGFALKIKLTFIPFILALLSAIVDYTGFYSNTLSSYKRGGFVVLLFILFITIDVLNNLAIQLRDGQRNAIYKELATTDILTGIYNRTAFTKWEAEYQENFSNTSIVLCDLNNLKYYNDNYGHEIGDKYIIDAAHIIKEAFKDKGQCYRIGGDEFVVTLHHISASSVYDSIDILKKLQSEYNSKTDILQIEIALGYAFSETSDQQLSDIINRADKLMYQQKTALKNVNHLVNSED